MLDEDTFGRPVTQRGDDGRERNGSGGEKLPPDHGVDQRALPALELAEDDEVEAILRQTGQQGVEPVVIARTLPCQHPLGPRAAPLPPLAWHERRTAEAHRFRPCPRRF